MLRAVADLEAGESARTVGARYGVSSATLYRWQRTVRAKRNAALERVLVLEAELLVCRETIARQQRTIDAFRGVLARKR
ncbi:MAG TPA: transposase [Candidatus Sulfotelmatobacter sp.]|nr:transposase [Candidatus Sulfotelmatobacter sp.]